MKSVAELADHTAGWSTPFFHGPITHTITGSRGSLHWIVETNGWELGHVSGQFTKQELESIRSLLDMMIHSYDLGSTDDH